MKKILIGLFALILLVGCGAKKETTTVCSSGSKYYTYSSAKQTIKSKGDKVTNILFEGILVAQSKEILDAYLPDIEEALEDANTIEGVETKFERLDDVTLKDIAQYNIEKADIKQLEEMGLMVTS